MAERTYNIQELTSGKRSRDDHKRVMAENSRDRLAEKLKDPIDRALGQAETMSISDAVPRRATNSTPDDAVKTTHRPTMSVEDFLKGQLGPKI